MSSSASGTMPCQIPDPIPLQEIRRVLVIKLRHHGDVLLTSPVFSVLAQALPQAELDALVYEDTREMLSLHPAIHEVLGVGRNWKRLGLTAQLRQEWRLLQALRARRYDLIVHLTEHWRGAWLCRLLKPRWSVGPAMRQRGKRWKRAFSHRYDHPKNALRHVVEANLDALRRIGIQPGAAERQLSLVPGAAAVQRIQEWRQQQGLADQTFIHIHPASRWFFKCWSTDGMAALVARLQAAGWPVVLSAAPDAAELALVEAIQTGLARLGAPAAHSLAGQLQLKELAALTAQARLFIGVDSAPMHMAAAVGTPVVALFGPSGERQWGPWGVPMRVVSSTRHPCRPCGIDGCGGGKVSDCLMSLGVDAVWHAVTALLAETDA